MSETKLFDVFLSHNSQDKSDVEQLARRLMDEAKLRPWLDKWNLIPGDPWQEDLEKALDSSRSCAIFVGPRGIGTWQNEEMRAALEERVNDQGFRVIPVLLPNAHKPAPRDLPRFLRRLTWVDFNVVEGLENKEAFRRLVAGIRGHAPGRDDQISPEPIPKDEHPRKALLILLTAFLAIASITLFVELAQRFLGGVDHASPVRNILLFILVLLVLLMMATLVNTARVWVERLLMRIGLFGIVSVWKPLLVSIVICSLLVTTTLSLPFVAIYYNNRGFDALQKNDLTAATLNYRRAINLSPGYAKAHYGLATIYDRSLKYDDAITEYKRVLELDDQFHHARNNLARLYLLFGKDRQDFETALSLLNQELQRSPTNEELLYSLYKNLGWANYRLENYSRAEDYLRQAIVLGDKDDNQKRAAAHCLLGYVLEAQKKAGASDEWDDCITFAPGQHDVEAIWLEAANTRLKESGQ